MESPAGELRASASKRNLYKTVHWKRMFHTNTDRSTQTMKYSSESVEISARSERFIKRVIMLVRSKHLSLDMFMCPYDPSLVVKMVLLRLRKLLIHGRI